MWYRSSDASSVVTDLDGDSICDELDDDVDGDGLLNDEETNTGNFDNEFDSLTDPANSRHRRRWSL